MAAFLFLIIPGIIVFVAIIFMRLAVKIVGPGFGGSGEDRGRGTTVLGVKLIRKHGDVLYRVLDDRHIETARVWIAVISPVNGKGVETRPQAANRTTRSNDASRLGGRIGKEDRQFLYISADRVNG